MHRSGSAVKQLLTFRKALREFREDSPKHAYCAFLDVLGTKTSWDDGRAAVARYADAIEAMLTPAMTHEIMTRADEMGWTHPISYLILSDAVVLTSGDLGTLLYLCAVASATAIRMGLAIRGYVASGLHLSRKIENNTIIISQALQSAYYGESRVAVMPRVVVAPELAKTAWGSSACGLAQDEDNLWFIDPFHFVEPPGEDGSWQRATEFTLQGLMSDDQSVRAKAGWLADFLNAKVFGDMPRYYSSGVSFRDRLQARVSELSQRESMMPIPVWEHDVAPERRFVLHVPLDIQEYDKAGKPIYHWTGEDGYRLDASDVGQSFAENFEKCCALAGSWIPPEARKDTAVGVAAVKVKDQR
jgi:hypothetical protein